MVRSEDFSPHFQGLVFQTLKLDGDETAGVNITNIAEVTKVWQPKN
jgi:hypothetical protein